MRSTRWHADVTMPFVVFVSFAATLVAGCGPQRPSGLDASVAVANAKWHPHERHPVQIHQPLHEPTIASGATDERGATIAIACGVCHATKPPNGDARIGTSLDLFHQGLVGKHGNLTCISCHHPGDGYASLRLADDRKLAYRDVMVLCAQCHGPQFRDYEHGAHGGMIGYWDRTKGVRSRNNCVDCHNPHDPRFPAVRPAPGPHDRNPLGGRHD